MAKQLAAILSDGSEETLAEGQETVQFWEILGGKAPYANDKRYQIILKQRWETVLYKIISPFHN